MRMDRRNPLYWIDGYKIDHRRQYPKGTQYVYANWTPRGCRIDGLTGVYWFGLQAALRHLLDEWNRWFFQGMKQQACEEYDRFLRSYLGPNDVGTEHIAELWEHGRLPLVIKALPEELYVPLRVPCMTIENTDSRFFWLTNYVETMLSNSLWLMTTSATSAARLRQRLNFWAKETGGAAEFVPWQGHDFSFRGMAGGDAAWMSGLGHLVAFDGTDTIPAILAANEYYPSARQVGGSVPATEHSVMCCDGTGGELETFRRVLQLYPQGIVSVVSDTWNLWRVLTEYLPTLRSEIMRRAGKLVIRPDSGDPVKIIVGDHLATDPSEKAGVIRLLYEAFGGSVNKAGLIELDPHIGCIYGDAITYDRANAICDGLSEAGFSSTNIVFGLGSYTYQYVTRDVFGFALKTTNAVIDGEERPLKKTPVTDGGEKFSAVGRLAVLQDESGRLFLKDSAGPDELNRSLMRTVYKDGWMAEQESLTTIRERTGLWGVST